MADNNENINRERQVTQHEVEQFIRTALSNVGATFNQLRDSTHNRITTVEAYNARIEASDTRIEAVNKRIEASNKRITANKARIEANNKRMEEFQALNEAEHINSKFNQARIETILIQTQQEHRQQMAPFIHVTNQLEGNGDRLDDFARRVDRIKMHVERNYVKNHELDARLEELISKHNHLLRVLEIIPKEEDGTNKAGEASRSPGGTVKKASEKYRLAKKVADLVAQHEDSQKKHEELAKPHADLMVKFEALQLNHNLLMFERTIID